jgi:hypothetical protein
MKGKWKIEKRLCGNCKMKFKNIYNNLEEMSFFISDGWHGEKLCHYCFPKVLALHMEEDYQQYLRKGGKED